MGVICHLCGNSVVGTAHSCWGNVVQHNQPTLPDCARCRSQIEQETRQQCWEDVLEILDDYCAVIKIPDTIKWELKHKGWLGSK